LAAKTTLDQPLRRCSQATKSEADEQTGSQSYIPSDPKDDKALHTALDLIRGTQKNSAYPPKPKTAVPN
jgi:carboxyl-terminal processing protease